MSFTIAEFWKKRLTVPARGDSTVLKGWKHVERLSTFLEAPLTLSPGFGDVNPAESGAILISAPGAVGKTTLARQVASETGAMFVDLSTADPVGANTLVGGLARTKLYEPFCTGNASLIVDGLDEARMRVNQDSFAAFMRDVADLVVQNVRPIVLLGRTGAVQEAWLWLSEQGIEVPVLEIGFYDKYQAAQFTRIQARHIRKEKHEREPDGRAIDLILDRIRGQAKEDADSFSGYSPVLIAVARWVADPNNPGNQNTQLLISSILRGTTQISVTDIANSILTREQNKLDNLVLEDDRLRSELYGPEEQLARLVARIYGTEPPAPPSMSPRDRETYNNALDTWVLEHPFLEGQGRYPSSAVFGGMIAAKALHTESSAEEALTRELVRGTAINPFISEFYIREASQESPQHVPAAHIGVIYGSLRARLSLDETANLRIDADATDDPQEAVEVEITRHNIEKELPPIRLTSEQSGHFRFGSHLENVDISAPQSYVSIGHESVSSDAVLVSPVVVDVSKITLNTNRLVLEPSPSKKTKSDPEPTVYLRADELTALQITSRPILHGNVLFQVSLGTVARFPWTEFAVETEDYPEDPQMDNALHRLKKILRLFGCHGKNQLGKYRGAIDHRRRTHGLGGLIRDQLLDEKVISAEGPMYILDPDRLVEAVGLTFRDVRGSGASATTIEFLRRALSSRA